MSSSLCTVCHGIDYSKPCHGPQYQRCGSGFSTHLFYPNHGSVEDLEDSAHASGCAFCSLLLAAINESAAGYFDEDEWEHVDQLLEADLAFTDAKGADGIGASHAGLFNSSTCARINPLDVSAPIIIEIVFREPLPDESSSRCTDIAVHWTESCLAGNASVRRKFTSICLVSGFSADLAFLLESRDAKRDTHTGSPDSLNLARLWLDSCDLGHQRCLERGGSLPPVLPTRVIDVGSEARQPHLHISAEGQRDKYVSLSHCWGTGKQYKTETTSLQARQISIPLEEMPKTFQDAVHATRYLGFRYLWIDSLCILQDSRDDWQHEANDMGRYYHGASLTIFALDAKGDNEGFYQARAEGNAAPCRTPMFDNLVGIMKGKSGSASYAQRISRHRFGVSPRLREYLFEKPKTGLRDANARNSFLGTRGWTLQEWVLSSRSLLFGAGEIRWICHSTSACDCIPEGVSNLPETPSTLGVDGHRGVGGSTQEALGHSEHWMTVVEEFTQRNLTFGKDKLPALAGVASEFSKYKPGEYLAGLWKGKLRIYLSWYAPVFQGGTEDLTSRPAQYRAPSWSWASVDGALNVLRAESEFHGTEVDWKRLSNTIRCDILDCWTKPLSPDIPFGEVVAGALILRCQIRQATVGKWQGEVPYFFRHRLSIFDQENGQVLGWLDPDDLTCQLAGSRVWCIPLTFTHAPNTKRFWSLALGAATSEEIREAEKSGRIDEPVFKRLGFVQEKWKQDPGMKATNQYSVESGKVTYDVNESLSTIGALVDWFEGAEEAVITII